MNVLKQYYQVDIPKLKKVEFMVFFIQDLHTIHNIDYIGKIIEIGLDIVTGVGIIVGLRSLKALKDKTYVAAFGFWSQFYNRVYELLRWLKTDNSIISNLYSPQARRGWENDLVEVSDRTKEFKKKVNDILDFLVHEADQMPAYVGWATDYNKLLEFFYDIVQYDICNTSECFKFWKPVDIEERDKYCEEIINTMENICGGIKKRQKILEKRIYKSKW